jgi:LmbE family N-acetylglucosaminyl deacetylase
VRNVIFCDFPDQRLDEPALLEIIRPIEQCIGDLGPDIVYTHFKEDVNQDHRVVFHATMVATRPLEHSSVSRVLCFETPSSTEWAPPFTGSVFMPNVYVDVTATLRRKLDALRAYSGTYRNEVRPFPHPRSYEALETYAKRHGITVGLCAAEPFMLVRELVRVKEMRWE